jgi:release factor glutamine methyltransferase
VKLFESIKIAKEIIKDAQTPQLDAEVILSNILKRDRSFLYINRDLELTEEIEKEFFEKIKRRQGGEPVQYINGIQEFMSLDFMVKQGVLIPRGDTEILVEEVLKHIKHMKSPILADVGCGSGAISVSLAKYCEDAFVYALDIMDTPLEVTEYNARMNGVSDRVRVLRSNKLQALIEKNIELDALISNPPYIRNEVIPSLMREVREFEPFEALSGGEDGLEFYRDITHEAMKILKSGGFIAYEIGYDQGQEVSNILKQNGCSGVVCIKDLAGLDRVVMGWRS